MNPKEQATQQSLQNLEQISQAVNNKPATWFQNYWTSGVDLPTFTEKEDFGKPLAQFSNFLIRDIIGGVVSAPSNLYQGGVDISKGQYYSGAGKIGKGLLDIASILPPVRAVGTAAKVAKVARAGEAIAPSLLKAAGKEALIQGGYGAGYGLSQGLIEAQGQAPEQRFKTIAKETAIGGGLGAGIGFLTPVVGAGIGKGIKLLKKEEVLAGKGVSEQFTKSSEIIRNEIPKTRPLEEISPQTKLKVREPLPSIKISSEESILNNIRKKSIADVTENLQKTEIRTAAKQVLRGIDEKVLPKVEGAVQDLKDKVLVNLSKGNIDGAKMILNQAPVDVRERASQWFLTLADRGDIPQSQKEILRDTIADGRNPSYMVNPSTQNTIEAKARAVSTPLPDMVDTAHELINVKQIVDKEFRDGLIQRVDIPSRINEIITDIYSKRGVRSKDIIDEINPVLTILSENGYGGISEEARKVVSLFGTGVGQTSQPFANYVNNTSVIDEALNIVQDTFSKVDPALSKTIKDTASDLVSETIQATDDILARPENSKELSEIGKKFLDKIEPIVTGKPKRKEKKPQEKIRDWVETEVGKIGQDPNATKTQKEIAQELINQNKKIYTEELNRIKTATKGVTENNKPYATMGAVLKMKPDLQKLVGKVRPLIRDLYQNDTQRKVYIDGLVSRRIGTPYTENQFNNVYRAFKKDNKVSIRDLAIMKPAEYEQFKIDSTAKLIKKLGVEPKDATGFYDEFLSTLDGEVSVVKAKIKQPYEVVAKRAIEMINKPITGGPIQTSEQKMFSSLVKQLSLVAADTQKQTLGTVKKAFDYRDMEFMLKNQSKYSEQWKKAQALVKQELANNPLAKRQLDNFLQRNVPEVFTDRQVQKIAFDQMKKNEYKFSEIVRMNGIARASKREDIIASLMLDLPGLTEEELAPLATSVMKFIKDKTENTRKEILQRYLDRLNLTPVQKKSADQKLLELHNLGMFDDATVTNQLFKVKDLPSISPEDTQYINEQLMLAQLPKGAERAIDLRTAYRNIGERLAESNKFKLNNWRDITTAFDAFYYNNIFSSFQTQERNILGGLVNAFIVKPSILLGEAIAKVFVKTAEPAAFADVADYYKSAFGSIYGGQAWNNFKNVFDPNYLPKLEQENIDTFYREARKKGLPPFLSYVGKFMEASDQFVSTIIESGTNTVLQKRGMGAQDAAQEAFLEAQKLLGRSNFGKQGWREVGVVDAFFDKIGNFGTAVKGKNNAWNFIMTPLVPVLRLAVNFQKLKSKLFLPSQLINMMTKKSRSLEDYAYLSISTALFGIAMDKYMKNEIAFEPPKDEAGRKLFFDSGRKPYSVKIGENWVPFQYLELMSAPFLFMGAVNAAYREDPNALTNSEVDKLGLLMQKFVKSYLVSPTYLNNIANAVEAVNGVSGKDWGNAVAYPITGLVPFVGLYRDVLDILDPKRRKKSTAWDEFNALYLPLRQQMETYKTSEMTDVPLNTSEIYAPYGIGTANNKYNDDYIKTIQTKQFGRQYIKTLETDKKNIETAKDQLYVAINTQDYAKAREIIVNNKLTPEQVGAVTDKFKEKDITKNFTPQELALYKMSGTDLEMLKNRTPELTSQINKISEIKKTFESGQKALYDELKNINEPFKPKKVKGKGGKKIKAKKIKAKKFKVTKAKTPKVKKLTAIKSPKV